MIAPQKRPYRRQKASDFRNCPECGATEWSYRRLTRIVSMTCLACGRICRQGDPLAPSEEQIAAMRREIDERRKAMGTW